MRYPAGISAEAYAAMEEGYDQGVEAGRAQMRAEVEGLRETLATVEQGYRQAIGVPASEHQTRRLEEMAQRVEQAEVLRERIRALARKASENDGRVDFDALMSIAYGGRDE